MLNIVNILCIILVVRCTLTVSDELFDANAVARNLNKSIEESDYETVIDIIVKHDPRERYLISEAYNVSVGIHPINKFDSVLTGNFKDLVLALMKPLPDYLIDELHDSLNTDNEAIIEILCTQNPYELDLIKKRYNRTFGNDLVSDLENSTSGDFKELVVSIARGNRDSIAKRVNLTLVAADAQELVDASGRTHDPTYSLYRLGERLTSGATQYVETGRTDGLDTGGDSPNILNAFTGPPVPQGEGSSIARAFLDGNHSLVSVMARINPSPDWFVGVDSFQLCVEGNWVETVTVELDPLDGGTDNGFTFTAANWATRPQGIAYRITSRYPAHPAGSFYYPNLPRLPPIATLTFTKLKEYTLTETYHEDDIEVEFVSNVSQKPGAPTPRGIDPNRELNEAIAEERREMDTQRYRYWTTGSGQQGGITVEPYDNDKAAIIDSIVSSYPLPRSRFSQQVTQATYAIRKSPNQIQQNQETRVEFSEDKARHEGKKISSSSNYYRKAEIYDDIQRRIANITSPGGFSHRGTWTNSTLAAKKHQHRLRMKHHRLQSKGKRLRSRSPRDCKVNDWGPWSACSRTCGVGETQRTRKIRLSPRRGGATCPPLKETKWCGSASPCPTNGESGKSTVDLFQW